MQTSTPESNVHGGTPGLGENKKTKLHSVTQIMPKKKDPFVQTCFLNGFEVLNAITVTTY